MRAGKIQPSRAADGRHDGVEVADNLTNAFAAWPIDKVEQAFHDALSSEPASGAESSHPNGRRDYAAAVEHVRSAADFIRSTGERTRETEARLQELLRSTAQQIGAAEARIAEADARTRAAEVRAQEMERRCREAEERLDQILQVISEELKP